jgi:hypothetical protein
MHSDHLQLSGKLMQGTKQLFLLLLWILLLLEAYQEGFPLQKFKSAIIP